jgi:hypothetical protein
MNDNSKAAAIAAVLGALAIGGAAVAAAAGSKPAQKPLRGYAPRPGRFAPPKKAGCGCGR